MPTDPEKMLEPLNVFAPVNVFAVYVFGIDVEAFAKNIADDVENEFTR
jgi:hypothetical protein